MNKRPYTDLKNLVDASTAQSTHEIVKPVVDKLDKATNKLEQIHPILEKIVRRQDAHLIWLAGLTAGLIIIGVVLIDHL